MGPTCIEHVIGQESAVSVLKTALAAHFFERSQSIGEPPAFGHTMIVGPAGAGKTTFCELIAAELGSQMQVLLGQNLRTPECVHSSLMMLERGGVLFVDEVHQISDQSSVALLRALEEQKLFLGQKPISLQPFTLIAATTDEHLLSSALRSRFKIFLRFTLYSAHELFMIVEQRARSLGWLVEDEASDAIATMGKGTPRLAIRHLDAARRVALSHERNEIRFSDVVEMMCQQELDPLGLDKTDRTYLEILREGHGATRISSIAMRLGLTRSSVELIETDLFRLGLVTKCDKGRSLTPRGFEHLTMTERFFNS